MGKYTIEESKLAIQELMDKTDVPTTEFVDQILEILNNTDGVVGLEEDEHQIFDKLQANLGKAISTYENGMSGWGGKGKAQDIAALKTIINTFPVLTAKKEAVLRKQQELKGIDDRLDMLKGAKEKSGSLERVDASEETSLLFNRTGVSEEFNAIRKEYLALRAKVPKDYNIWAVVALRTMQKCPSGSSTQDFIPLLMQINECIGADRMYILSAKPLLAKLSAVQSEKLNLEGQLKSQLSTLLPTAMNGADTNHNNATVAALIVEGHINHEELSLGLEKYFSESRIKMIRLLLSLVSYQEPTELKFKKPMNLSAHPVTKGLKNDTDVFTFYKNLLIECVQALLVQTYQPKEISQLLQSIVEPTAKATIGSYARDKKSLNNNVTDLLIKFDAQVANNAVDPSPMTSSTTLEVNQPKNAAINSFVTAFVYLGTNVLGGNNTSFAQTLSVLKNNRTIDDNMSQASSMKSRATVIKRTNVVVNPEEVTLIMEAYFSSARIKMIRLLLSLLVDSQQPSYPVLKNVSTSSSSSSSSATNAVVKHSTDEGERLENYRKKLIEAVSSLCYEQQTPQDVLQMLKANIEPTPEGLLKNKNSIRNCIDILVPYDNMFAETHTNGVSTSKEQLSELQVAEAKYRKSSAICTWVEALVAGQDQKDIEMLLTKPLQKTGFDNRATFKALDEKSKSHNNNKK